MPGSPGSGRLRAAAIIALRGVSAPQAMLVGCLILFAGAVVTVAAIETGSAATFLAGTAVAGTGFGMGFFLGAFRILTRLADPGHRAGLIATIWIVFFAAFSLPVVIAGVATTRFGLHQTAVVYSAALAVLAAAAAGSFVLRKPGRDGHAAGICQVQSASGYRGGPAPPKVEVCPHEARPVRERRKRPITTEAAIMVIFDNPATVPAPVGQYSHVARVELGDRTFLQLSGQVAIDADGKVVGDDMSTQAEYIMDRINAILAAHGATFADVVNVRTFLTDMSQLPEYGKVRAARFPGTPPTITTVEVSRLFVPGALLEVEVLAIT